MCFILVSYVSLKKMEQSGHFPDHSIFYISLLHNPHQNIFRISLYITITINAIKSISPAKWIMPST